MAKKPVKNPEIVDDLNKVEKETTTESPVNPTVDDDADQDSLLEAEIDKLLAESVPTAPKFSKPATEKGAAQPARQLAKIGLGLQRENEIVLTLNCFGQVLPTGEILNGFRSQILNPVFNKKLAPESSVFARFARACNVLFPEYQIALATDDRVAIDGAKCVDLSEVLINVFENGKDSKVCSPLATPEVSLAVRFYLQCVIAHQMITGNTKAKFFAVGKSETYKHVSSTAINFRAILRACIAPYTQGEDAVFFDTDQHPQPKIAYGKAGIIEIDGKKSISPATAYTLQELGKCTLSACNDIVKPGSILSLQKVGDFINMLEVLAEKKLEENAKP